MRHFDSLMLAGALGVLCFPTVAFANPADANAQEFYVDAQALLAKGTLAMLDKRTKPRMAQLKAAGEAARDANQAATQRGKPLYCVGDADRKKGLNPQMAISMLGSLPEAQRRRSTLRQAWLAALVREYPCS